MTKISEDDVSAIAHVNYVANNLHDSVDELYEDLMERDNEKAKVSAQEICRICAELIQSLSDEI
tara:strand:+ start:1189 stop:1380 length:192 start_codon:yes stop_codon:yes gene_type:complete